MLNVRNVEAACQAFRKIEQAHRLVFGEKAAPRAKLLT